MQTAVKALISEYDLMTIISVAPNLKSLSTSHWGFPSVVGIGEEEDERRHPGISHMGMLRTPVRYIDIPSRDVVERMLEIKRFPSLEVIRLLCGTRNKDILAWKELVPLFQRYGVRIEDVHCRHLNICVDHCVGTW